MRKPRAHGPTLFKTVTAAQGCGIEHIDDWWWLAHASRPNGLIVGPDIAIARIVGALDPWMRRPVVHWPGDRSPWEGPPCASTLIIHDVATLARHDQLALLTWLNDRGRDAQVISLSSSSVYPLVKRGAFLERLYYRINSVYVDCSE